MIPKSHIHKHAAGCLEAEYDELSCRLKDLNDKGTLSHYPTFISIERSKLHLKILFLASTIRALRA